MKKILLVTGMLLLAGCQTLQNQTMGGGEDGHRTYFAYDSAVLTKESQKRLEKQAEWLTKYPKTKVVVEGHADERGTREYNLALGERRANAVRNYLTNLGIEDDRIDTVSYGKERPAVLGSNEQSWSKNRRAETVIRP